MNSSNPTRKEKIKHELTEMLVLFLYLGFFFCSLAVYDMLLLKQYTSESLDFAFAIINALVITKVIMIGEYAKLGKRHENKALVYSAIWKAFVFCLLVFAFHIVEEIVKRLIHGSELATASRQVRFDNLAGRSIVIFCVFIPLFAFREFRRVMGEESFRDFLLGAGHSKG